MEAVQTHFTSIERWVHAMSAATIAIRTTLLTVFSSLFVCGAFKYRSIVREEASAKKIRDCFDAIKPGDVDRTYKRIFGNADFDFEMSHWPKTIGDIPQFQDGFPRPWDKDVLFSPKTEIKWSVTVLPGKREWIALGYFMLSKDIRLFVAKRRGVFQPNLPEVTFRIW